MNTSIRPKSILLCAAAPLLLLAQGAASPARASVEETRSKIVWMSDLDLTSPDGRKELDRRINRAAHSVCDPWAGSGNVLAAQCVRLALKNARQDVQSRLMTAERGSRPIPVDVPSSVFDQTTILADE